MVLYLSHRISLTKDKTLPWNASPRHLACTGHVNKNQKRLAKLVQHWFLLFLTLFLISGQSDNSIHRQDGEECHISCSILHNIGSTNQALRFCDNIHSVTWSENAASLKWYTVKHLAFTHTIQNNTHETDNARTLYSYAQADSKSLHS